jgi:AbiV family abortive infection protein
LELGLLVQLTISPRSMTLIRTGVFELRVERNSSLTPTCRSRAIRVARRLASYELGARIIRQMDETAILHELVDDFGRAAADNALQLVEEADLLEEHGHGARAFALTVFAAEELGKAFICTMSVSHDDWAVFDAMVRGSKKHQTKLLGALFLMKRAPKLAGEPGYDLAEELRDLVAGDLDTAKMRALYVDIETSRGVRRFDPTCLRIGRAFRRHS